MTHQHDVFNDSNHAKLLDIFERMEVPEFVKEATVHDEQDFSEVRMDMFGDPSRRMYPLNSRSNTWLSREYFKKDRASLRKEAADAIERRIQKAAEFWKLEPSKEKERKPETPAYVVDVRHDGKTVMNFPLASHMECKEAVEYLRGNRSRLTYDMRVSYARGLLTAPDELRRTLSEDDELFLEKTAGFGVALPEHVNHAIATRIAAVGRTYPFYAEKLAMAAHELKDTELNPSILRKVASMLDLVDRATEMHKAYDKGLKAPEDELFSLTQKAASWMKEEIVELANGRRLSKTALLEKKVEVDSFFQNVIGEIPYSNDTEMIDVIKSLPRDDADSLVEAIG